MKGLHQRAQRPAPHSCCRSEYGAPPGARLLRASKRGGRGEHRARNQYNICANWPMGRWRRFELKSFERVALRNPARGLVRHGTGAAFPNRTRRSLERSRSRCGMNATGGVGPRSASLLATQSHGTKPATDGRLGDIGGRRCTRRQAERRDHLDGGRVFRLLPSRIDLLSDRPSAPGRLSPPSCSHRSAMRGTRLWSGAKPEGAERPSETAGRECLGMASKSVAFFLLVASVTSSNLRDVTAA